MRLMEKSAALKCTISSEKPLTQKMHFISAYNVLSLYIFTKDNNPGHIASTKHNKLRRTSEQIMLMNNSILSEEGCRPKMFNALYRCWLTLWVPPVLCFLLKNSQMIGKWIRIKTQGKRDSFIRKNKVKGRKIMQGSKRLCECKGVLKVILLDNK